MRNQLLSACLTALALAGCKESPRPPPAVAVEAPTPRPSLPEEPKQVEVAMTPALDAGSVTEPTPEPEIDLLGLTHEHRGPIDHLARARALRSEGDLSGALTEARRALFDDPGDEDALELVGRLGRITRQKSVAAEAFGRLATVRPDDSMPLVQQARMLLSMGDIAGALEAGEAAVARDSENPEGHQVVGRAELSAGRLSAAIVSFQKVLELMPEHGYALNNLGFAYLRANENEKAVEALTRAAELLPNLAYVHNNLGVALERSGQVEEAKLAYAKATSLSPKYVKALINAQRVAKVDTTPEAVPVDDIASDLVPDVDLPQE